MLFFGFFEDCMPSELIAVFIVWLCLQPVTWVVILSLLAIARVIEFVETFEIEFLVRD
jgi:hypothetical protein